MRHLKKYMAAVVLMMAALPLQAQDAFYIYQNDGHFDGFFYDEIEKMSYSKTDTLGIEHDEYVSQIIQTADSTYCIMLSAIDSIGFQQPEVKYNPRAHVRLAYPYESSEADNLFWSYLYDYPDNYICIFSSDMPADIRPREGDVLVNFDPESGYAYKVRSVDASSGNIYVYLEDVEDISDIFQQYITVEEYDEDKQGNMVRRRIAGRPDLTIGEFPRKTSNRSSEGTWSGDIFNFSVSGHIPLYHDENLDVSIDPSVEGKLNIKVIWNLSFWGDKYINITSTLDYGVSCGFTVDGKIADLIPSGISELVGLPVPATCPLFIIKPSPDMFLRGEAHVKFSASSPKIKGRLRDIWTIKNWWPEHDQHMSSFGDELVEPNENNKASASIELNGFVQAGLKFPLGVRTLPVLDKIFKAELEGRWLVGPKLSGAVSLDLTNTFSDLYDLQKTINESTHYYDLLKNTKLTLGLCDADFEIEAKVKTLLSGEQKVKIAEGTIPIVPHREVSFAPEFEKGEEYTENRVIEDLGDESYPCRVIAFKPKGVIVKEVPIGVQVFKLDKDGNEVEKIGGYTPLNLYLSADPDVDLPKSKWAQTAIPYHKGEENIGLSGRFRARPWIGWGDNQLMASEKYEFEHGAILKPSSSELYLNPDGTTNKPVNITGTCDAIGIYRHPSEIANGFVDDCPDYLSITGEKGKFVISSIPEKLKKRYNPCDTISLNPVYNHAIYYGGVANIEGEIFRSDAETLYVYSLPNKTDDPRKARISVEDEFVMWNNLYPNDIAPNGITPSVTRLEGDKGWHISIDTKNKKKETEISVTAEFDIVWDVTDQGNAYGTDNKGVFKGFHIRNESAIYEYKIFNENHVLQNYVIGTMKPSSNAIKWVGQDSSFNCDIPLSCTYRNYGEESTGVALLNISVGFSQ